MYNKMPEFKLNINDVKTGKSYKKIVSGNESDIFKNKKIKDKIIGDSFGLKGYEFEITGGSDIAGFPMRSNIPGIGRKKVLLTKGPGVKIKRKGMKKRKSVVGSTLSHLITQINLKTITYGNKSFEEVFGKKEEIKPKEAEEKTQS